jgi:hypothetical protein
VIVSVVSLRRRAGTDHPEVQFQYVRVICELETAWIDQLRVAIASVQQAEPPKSVLDRIGMLRTMRKPVGERLWNPGDWIYRNYFTGLSLTVNSSKYVVDVGSDCWKLIDNDMTVEEYNRLRSNAHRPLKVSPAVMAGVVSGKVEDFEDVFIAEGQIARLAFQASSDMERLSFFEIWLCIIDRLVEPAALVDVISLHHLLASDGADAKERSMNINVGVGSDSPQEKSKAQRHIMCRLMNRVREDLDEVCYVLSEEHKAGIPADMVV